MPLRVMFMQSSDIPAMFRIRDAALLPSQAPISCLLFRPPFSSLMHQREVERLNAQNGTLFFKAVDADTETMIACMRARVVPASTASPESAISLPPWPKNCSIGEEAWHKCWKSMGEAKKECFENVKHIYLDLLATDPAYQRKGAARCLLKELTDFADREGVDVFLVSTDAARCSYERVLFVAIKEIVLDITGVGEASGGQERFTFMIRRPRAATTPGAA